MRATAWTLENGQYITYAQVSLTVRAEVLKRVYLRSIFCARYNFFHIFSYGNDYHNEYCVGWRKANSSKANKESEVKTVSSRTKLLYNAIHALDNLKKAYPETKISVETPSGCLELEIGDTLFFEDCDGELAINSK